MERPESSRSTHDATRLTGRVVASEEGDRDAVFDVQELVIAGWTARDKAAMEHHIAELEAMGVKRPAQTPTFYHAAHHRLTQASRIEVTGEQTSGELEYVLVESGGALYVGIGSDHTDRELETVGITLSKQICDKPVGTEFWPYEEVAGHWDQLILRAHAVIDGERHLYQEGGLAAMIGPEELVRRYDGASGMPRNGIMFGGTLPAIGGVRPADAFEGTIEDPVLNRALFLRYEVRRLPING